MPWSVNVVPYDPAWPRMFQQESGVLSSALGSEMVAIHHIGSTAIPGISAKPIIDVLVDVADIEKIDRLNPEMERLGYVPHGEFGIPGRRYLTKDCGSTRTHHVHIFQTGDPEIARHLAFRDYLIAQPDEAQAYSRVKEELARQFPNDRDAYQDGKDAFIKEMDRRAGEWTLQLPNLKAVTDFEVEPILQPHLRSC